MDDFSKLGEKIKALKNAREILHEEYTETDFHKRKESHPHSTVPPSPEDEGIYKLLNAIHQIDGYIKKFQDEQLKILKEQDQEEEE